ncbi:MAG: hypothetical protein ABI689_05245 [Thermoanaerobaculia bacterium]
MRFRRRFAAAGYLGLAVVIACSPVKTAAPAPAVDSDLRAFLLDPTADCGTDPEAPDAAELQRAYRDLLLSGDASAALRIANPAIERTPGDLAAQILRGEALLVGSQARVAAGFLQPFAAAAADCLPLALVLGRSQELAGDLAEAFVAYSGAAGRSATAATRAREISGRAQEIVRNRFSEAFRAGRREAAAWNLSRLERFWPNSEAALRATMEMARVAEDTRGELAAVKALQASSPLDPALTLRRGQLELLIGDARAGLALIEALAASAPGDPVLQTELARAKFAWRLLNSPEQIRGLRDKVVLTRADFAVMLYWMVPQIRTARPGAVQIASDIVDHPSRDEIARVANLGLMTIDESLHRFSPDVVLRRSDAVAALLRLLANAGPREECRLPRAGGREGLCRTGASCGLFEDPALCQAGSGISGSEALEMLRRALDRLEGA